MLSTTLATLLVATWAAILVSWLKRFPTAQFCPKCTNRTEGIVAPLWLRPMARWLTLRWCADCEWQGVGRTGPEYVPGRQIAHDSGFHWGADETGENMGFDWKQTEELPPLPTPPSHPSGFRFSDDEPGADSPKRGRSGFAGRGGPRTPSKPAPQSSQWGDSDVQDDKNKPSGFRWGN